MSITVKMTTDAERERGFVAAKSALARGECVLIPTDTGYGIAADPFVPKGIDKLFAVKKRNRDMPVPVLVPNLDSALALSYKLSAPANLLMSKFWPGAVTVIVTAHPTLKWDFGDFDGTVALRIPLQRTALEFLARTGPLGVTSATLASEPPVTEVEVAQERFGNSISVYLDAGSTHGNTASTIIDATNEQLRVIREGAVPISEIAAVIGSSELLAVENE
jgi:tRNA threonylcarbamoyl adenosine modification protein (Sua5/YciO/YrdC/YwlC family)